MRGLLILILLVVFTALPMGHAFQCFICTKADESCDTPKKEHLQECSSVKGKVSTCIKIQSQGQTARTCGIPGLKTTTCTSTGGTTVCLCEREFCNSAHGLRQGYMAVSAGLLMTIWLAYGMPS